MIDNDLDLEVSNESEFGSVLLLKKSLFKIKKPAFLCEINPSQPYYLKIIYCNNEFIENFSVSQKDILGKNFDFLFDNIDAEYSDNYLQYVALLKAVKNFKSIEVNIDITSQNGGGKYKISFHPNSFKSEYLYSIITFENALQSAKDRSNFVDEVKPNLGNKTIIQKLERKLRSEAALRLISGIVVSDVPLKQIADNITKILCEHLKVTRCILYDYKDDGRTGFISEFCSKETKPMLEVNNPKSLEVIGSYINFQNQLFKNFNLTTKSNTTLVCEDVKKDVRFNPIEKICEDFNIASQISIVTTFDGRINGGLFLHQADTTRWNVGEVEFLEIVAEQFSIAIDRSHSLDKVMDINQRLLDKTLQLKKALKEEKKMRQMQSEFVAMVSHEFKTPLQIIDGARELLMRKIRALNLQENSMFNSLDKIKSGIERLNGLIQSNLNLSKIEMNQNEMKINKAPFSLIDLVNDILDKNSNLSATKSIIIQQDISALPIDYNGDKKLLDHCLTNVITNAIKYSKSNSKVKIFGFVDDKNNAVIRVKDSGIGIPKEDLENIGKKFFRAKNTLEVSGTGIGLYLTKYFVELHNGSVLIESDLGVGTTISVILPIS